MCFSPQLFAACHVLLRLLAPRHSPFALSSLTYESQMLKHLLFVEICCAASNDVTVGRNKNSGEIFVSPQQSKALLADLSLRRLTPTFQIYLLDISFQQAISDPSLKSFYSIADLSRSACKADSGFSRNYSFFLF